MMATQNTKKTKKNLVFAIYFKLRSVQNYYKCIIFGILRTISKEVWKPDSIF